MKKILIVAIIVLFLVLGNWYMASNSPKTESEDDVTNNDEQALLPEPPPAPPLPDRFEGILQLSDDKTRGNYMVFFDPIYRSGNYYVQTGRNYDHLVGQKVEVFMELSTPDSFILIDIRAKE